MEVQLRALLAASPHRLWGSSNRYVCAYVCIRVQQACSHTHEAQPDPVLLFPCCCSCCCRCRSGATTQGSSLHTLPAQASLPRHALAASTCAPARAMPGSDAPPPSKSALASCSTRPTTCMRPGGWAGWAGGARLRGVRVWQPTLGHRSSKGQGQAVYKECARGVSHTQTHAQCQSVTHTHTHVCTHRVSQTHSDACSGTHTHTRMQWNTRRRVRTCKQTICAQAHARTHKHAQHTYTRMYTHTPACPTLSAASGEPMAAARTEGGCRTSGMSPDRATMAASVLAPSLRSTRIAERAARAARAWILHMRTPAGPSEGGSSRAKQATQLLPPLSSVHWIYTYHSTYTKLVHAGVRRQGAGVCECARTLAVPPTHACARRLPPVRTSPPHALARACARQHPAPQATALGWWWQRWWSPWLRSRPCRRGALRPPCPRMRTGCSPAFPHARQAKQGPRVRQATALQVANKGRM